MENLLRKIAVQSMIAMAFVFLCAGAWAQAKVTVESEISKSGSLVLEVRGVDNASVSATPVERISPNGKQLYCAYDIDITKDGREWQPEPEQPALVSMENTNFADGQLLDIYHEGANGLEFVATVASENGKITFPAHSFSVYIVAQAGDYARLKVNLHRADGTVVTIYVKKLDITEGDFNRIVYNPGIGTPADGVDCMGWIDIEDYDAENISNTMTFDDIRTYIADVLNDGVEDGTTVDFYAMLFKHYSVTYLAENESVLHTDVLPFRADADISTLNYFVNASYQPASSTQNFEGWLVNSRSDGDHIVGHNDDFFNYTNSTEIGITGDVNFRVNVSEGHWLIYKENGKGATYKAADFIRQGEVTEEPTLVMRRNGYTFEGWWTGAPETDEGVPTGTRFVFGGELSQDTLVYAKWSARETAKYAIIIWKQNVSGTGYDFGDIITDLPEGSVGSRISTVTAPNGTGSINSYARVNNVNKQYPGFHLDSLDQNVLIKTEGNAVLNIYYGRNEYTLHFQAETTEYTYTPTTSYSGTQYGLVNGEYVQLTKYGTKWYYGNTRYTGTRYTRTSNYGWHDIKTINALYQQSIGNNFPIVGTNGVTYNNGERWMPQSTTGQFDDVIVFIEIMPAENNTFRLNTADKTTKTMRYYVETVDGAAGDVTYGGTNYLLYNTIYANLGYLDRDLDWLDLNGYDKYTSNPAFPDDGHMSPNTLSVDFYYHRKVYSINYMDGAYYDGNGSQLTSVASRGSLGTVSGIAYGANIASYNNETYATVPDGYVFEGWYSDETCTQPYNFTTMPSASITVYAKWRQIQYRVFLHPNVDAEDISLNWGSDDQAMNFRITYGNKVSTPTGRRADYEFVGWYTDEQFRHAFSEEATPLNETTVTTPYDKTDKTDVMDKWGNIESDSPYPDGTAGPGYNSDSYSYDERTGEFSERDRFWITKKFDLYGKWRAILRGAIGIEVIYDDGEGDNAPTDSKLYQDNAYAIVGHASSHATKEFSHWVLQHWNGDEFVDSDIDIYPGATFLVQKRDAKMHDAAWYNSNEEEYTGGPFDTEGLTAPDPAYTIFRAIYTIKLRAEYVEKETAPSQTSIVWFMNDGTGNEVRNDTDLQINKDVTSTTSIPSAPSRKGYVFKGWHKYKVTSGEPPATITIDGCTPNFLTYDNGTYRNATNNAVATKVAADLYEQTDYLYAIWAPETVFDINPVCKGSQITLPTANTSDIAIDGTWSASDGTISGTTYTAPAAAESVRLTFTPNPSTCAQANSFDVSIVALNYSSIPSTCDYLWKGGAASPADWNTASNWYVYNSADHTYSVADAVPTNAKNIYIGEHNCEANINPSVGNNEAYAKNITIASGATLTVPAGMTLNIAGNLDNIGTLAATEGNIVFCGTSVRGESQTITRSVKLGKVTFNNRGGNIVHEGTLIINNVATFTNGVVEGDVIFGENSSVDENMTYRSYVNGKVEKIGSANGFTFPTGSNNVLGKVKTMSNVSDVTVQYFNNPAGFDISEYPRWWNAADNCDDNDPRLDHVSNFEYWSVQTSGVLNATLTVSAADSSAHFNAISPTHDGNDIYGAFWTGSCWANIGGANHTISNNPYGNISVEVVVPATRTTSEKILSIGSIDHNTVLPIELTSFNATCDGRSTLVEWTTATEKNNDYFSIERSDDAINFTEIARVAGAGNSIDPIDYAYTDYGTHGGDNYYRLVQVDYDGTRTVSEIVVANCVESAEGTPEVMAFPNPFSGELNLVLGNFDNRAATIEVYDMLGKLVYIQNADATQNYYEMVLNLENLSKGAYTVRVSTVDFVINHNVVKN